MNGSACGASMIERLLLMVGPDVRCNASDESIFFAVSSRMWTSVSPSRLDPL